MSRDQQRAPSTRARMALAALIALALPGAAAGAEWTLTAHAGWTSSDQTLSTREGEIVRSADVGGGASYDLGLDARFGRRLGFAVDLAQGGVDFDVALDIPTLETLRARDQVSWLAVELSAPISLVRRDAVDLFVAPVFAWATFDDVVLTFPALADETVVFDVGDDTGFGVRLGVRTPIGSSGWVFDAHVQYLELAVSGPNRDEPADRLELDLDPWSAVVGFGWRF